MNIEKDRKLFEFLGFKGTLDILFYLREHGKTSYKEFNIDVSVYTMNRRLRELIQVKLIKRCMRRNKRRKEWYKLTEKKDLSPLKYEQEDSLNWYSIGNLTDRK